MMENTDLLEQEAAADPDLAVPTTEAEPTAAPVEPSENEVRARAMGWVPKEEFRGPAENWRDADEFVKRGEEEMPVLRERNRDMARRLSEYDAKLEKLNREFDERVARQERMSRVALQRQRDAIHSQYEAAKRQAVEMGDAERYDQLTRDQGQAINQYDQQIYGAYEAPQPDPKHQQAQQHPEPPPEVKTEVEGWIRQNPWFNNDPELNRIATQYHGLLQVEQPGLSLRDNLAQVTRYVAQKFPQKFGVAPRQTMTAVEGSGRVSSGAGRRAKGIGDLPAEAKRAGEEFVRDGTFKDLAEYAREYWSQDGV